MLFTAVDFETFEHHRDSACAVGAVVVSEGRIRARCRQDLRPPSIAAPSSFRHCAPVRVLARQPTFREFWWKRLRRLVVGVDFLAMHHAPFDLSVLRQSCRHACVDLPRLWIVDTVAVAKRVWGLRRASLPRVCSFLKIPLNHHDALSDAEACARIVLEAGPRWARRLARAA